MSRLLRSLVIALPVFVFPLLNLILWELFTVSYYSTVVELVCVCKSRGRVRLLHCQSLGFFGFNSLYDWPLTRLANAMINGWICQTGQFSLVFKTLAYNDSLCGVFVRNIWYLKLWPQILICSFSRVFQARGLKKHLKRLNAPKHWMLDKLGGAFVCTVLTVVDDIICHFYL